MAKTSTLYFCQTCGAQSVKWIGKCPSCNSWNTYVEEVVTKTKGASSSIKISDNKPTRIDSVESLQLERIDSKNGELNRVLGSGIVPGSLVLIGGEPGIGKSTLMLQVALSIKGIRVLYITGEESTQQIKMRADRIGVQNPDCLILNETSTQYIMQHIDAVQPQLVIIDSIQTLHSDLLDSVPGSIGQVRQCAAELQRYAKSSDVPVFIVGHITKDGSIAGPKVLEHMVDTVLQFEGETNTIFRILRTTKNRFGSTSELGIYEMRDNGLREVVDPSEVLLAHRDDDVSGIAVSAVIEGMRAMLIEVQSLVSSAAYGTPQRSSTGFDLRRLNMLLAVLEKRCGFKINSKDVFLNIAGGLRIEDPANDLAVICSVLSSSEDIAIDKHVCFAAEVGLSGELRPVSRIEQRIAEAEKLGFKTIVISHYNLKGLQQGKFKIEIKPLKKVSQVFSTLFG